MISITSWILFWKYLLIIGFGSFAILVLVIIPLGARDVFRLFKNLDEKSTTPPDTQD
ncbi:MAG: hypothetical protein JKY95_13765 [Planctomycetaceae bacterium]|nr:hypothetical protein [Planctomycetaceae bacterium]